ncbi:MAG: branched-chain amino acid transaminase [Chloroflexi bacterium]|nr:branched-chain amino acid transaminase [Chloroflexota bacterium]
MGAYAYFHKQIVPLEEAKIGIMTHAFNYGTGVFEGIRGNWNSARRQTYLFRVRDHFERLKKSAHSLRIEVKETVDELCSITVDIVQRSGYQEDVYIRPIAYKSAEEIGVRLHNLQDDITIFVHPFGSYLDADKGIRCCTSSWRRVPDSSIPGRAKVTGIYVNSALAKSEAFDRGCDEAILLTQEGNVSEGSGENIFLVSGGKLITPPPAEGILVGITRNTVIELAAREFGIETVERAIPRSELFGGDEVFMTGTAAHVTPVVEIDSRAIGDGETGPITLQIMDLYGRIIRGNQEAYQDWVTAIAPATVVV